MRLSRSRKGECLPEYGNADVDPRDATAPWLMEKSGKQFTSPWGFTHPDSPPSTTHKHVRTSGSKLSVLSSGDGGTRRRRTPALSLMAAKRRGRREEQRGLGPLLKPWARWSRWERGYRTTQQHALISLATELDRARSWWVERKALT
jgi:hypothetical protein